MIKKILLLFLIFLLAGCGRQIKEADKDNIILKGTSTFGYTEEGEFGQWVSANYLYCTVKFTSPDDISGATVSKISMYVKEDRSGDLYAKGVIVKASDKAIVANGVGSSVLVPSSYTWKDSTFSTSPSLDNSTDYYLCITADSGMQNLAVAYDIDDVFDEWRDTSNSFTTPTNPTDGELSGNAEKYSMYVTYVTGEEPPASTPTSAQQIIIFD